MKIDPSCCRLCFTHADEPIDIFGDAAREFNIVNVLAQYFLDEVVQDDALPKVVCHDCWSQIETFHSFVQRVIAVREDYLRHHLNERVKEEEVPDESAVLMDEREIHEENICVEPVSMISHDPLTNEIELMDTKFQINIENDEDEQVSTNDEEFEDTWSDTDQIDDQNTSNIETLVHIDRDTGTKSSNSELESQRVEKKHAYEKCNKKSGSKILAQKQRTHPKKPKRAIQPKGRSLSSDDSSTEQPPSDENSMNDSTCDEKNKDVIIADYFDMKCDLCPVVFTSFKDARSHYLDVHHMENGYLKCCNTKFILDSLIKDHLAWHKDPNVFRCNECNKSYLNRQGLAKHKKNHSRDFVCNICSKRYSTALNLTTHLQSHEKRERNFICDICNKGFFKKIVLNAHMKTHQKDKTHICEICGKGYITKSHLKAHAKVHDETNNERQFQCNICQRRFTTKYTLAAHMLAHTEPQKCDKCDKIAPNLSALKAHIRHVHCELKFECHLCDKKFKVQSTLKDHITSHKGERNNKCTFCNATFVLQRNMHSHRKKRHKEQWMAEMARTKAKCTKL